MSRRTALVVAVILAMLGVAAWRFWPDDERDVRRRLRAFASDFNESTTDGLGTLARAARLGSYFTDDVIVELGQGAPPIRGRETLIGMVARLQPRAATFTLELLDIRVNVPTPATADVTLTAAFRNRNIAAGEDPIEAQELALRMAKIGSEWRIDHVTAIEPFR